jgi:hypothetical protein
MISKEFFFNKLREYSHLVGRRVETETAEFLYPYFKDADEEDLSKAIASMAKNDEWLSLKKLSDAVSEARRFRLDNIPKEKAIIESLPKEIPVKCEWGNCGKCPCLITGCQIRGKEWLKNLRNITFGNGGKKGGKEKAEEIIRYMKEDFYGGSKN